MKFQKIDEERRLCGGIVYRVSNSPDAQGDFCDDPDVLWDALESFMLKGGTIKKNHCGSQVAARVIECFQPDEDTIKGDTLIPAGCWWLTVKILDSNLWEQVKDGSLSGFSFAGFGEAEELEV